jgi:hypothetical protein
VKCDQQQQTHEKNDVSNYGINLQKIILNSPITILAMFPAGESSHKIDAVFCWFKEGFCGFGLWEIKMLWVQVMGVTLVYFLLQWLLLLIHLLFS